MNEFKNTLGVNRVHICNICENLFSQGDAEVQKGYSKNINEHLCMPCIDAVTYLRSKKRAKFVE